MELDLILQKFAGLENEASLRAEFSSTDEKWQREFIHAIDKSPHSLADWLKAHDIFLGWAKKNNRNLPLERRQEYLCCSLEGMKDPAGNFSLESILIYYLERNGVD
jgi:hypothetical protein